MSHGDTLRALKLTCASVGTVAEAELIHLCDHRLGPFCGLWTALREKSEGTYPGGNKEHSRTVFTGCYASSATHTSRSIHTLLRLLVRNEDIVGILS